MMPPTAIDFPQLVTQIKTWGRALGFQELGISDTDLTREENYLQQWLSAGYHGEMDYMARHGTARTRAHELVPGTMRVITARLNYLPPVARESWETLEDPDAAFISRYALGRDYHKVLRAKLQNLATKIEQQVGKFQYRVFTDSAPVMEVALARKAGLGWRGKHTLLLTRDAGSWFFLGEIYTDLPLPVDGAVTEHCGSCTKCIDVCPTKAIVAPYQLDARRCISYLTIEHKGAIPLDLRPLIGNRIYGCDDCQLICPWNKFATASGESDFSVRNGLDDAMLVELFQWSKETFDQRLEGSPIRRIGHERWLRNIAVAMGNSLFARPRHASAPSMTAALEGRKENVSAMVREHIMWALAQAPSD